MKCQFGEWLAGPNWKNAANIALVRMAVRCSSGKEDCRVLLA